MGCKGLLILAMTIALIGAVDGFDYEYRLLARGNQSAVITSIGYPFSALWRDAFYRLWREDGFQYICLRFKKFYFAPMLDERSNYVKIRDRIYKLNGVVNDTQGVPSHLHTVWGDNFCFQDWWLNVEAYRVGSNSDTGLSYGFYAEYYATNDICVEPTDTKEVLCDPDTEFRCVGYETRCLNVTDLCGEVPLCSDGSDLSYAHAGCDNDENEWDMDDVERTGRLLNETGNRYWIQELYDYGGGVLYADPYAPGSAHLNIRKPRSFSDQGPVCLSFWYEFSGAEAVNLRILASSEDPHSSQNLALVWSRERRSGSWRQSQVFFSSFEVTFVRFEADQLYPGIKPYRGSWIYLDDIRWIPGRCPQAEETSSTSVDGVSQWEISGGMAVPSTRNVTYRSDWPGRVSAYSWAMIGQDWSITTPYSGQDIASCLVFHYRSVHKIRSIEFSIWSFQGERLDRRTKQLSGKYLTWQPFRLNTYSHFSAKPFMVRISGSATSRDPFFIENPVFYKEGGCSIGCSVEEFLCDSQCHPLHLRCDGSVDCQDKSDEKGCPHLYEYVNVLQPDESGRGVIMSDNYPFMYQKRQYRYVIDAGNTSSQVCFNFQKFQLHYDMLLTVMDQLIIGFGGMFSNGVRYVGNGDAVRMDMSHGIFDYTDVPARWLSVWGNDTCFSVHPERGTLSVLLRTQSVWDFRFPHFIAPRFYAEYYIISDRAASISPAPPSCDAQRYFQCYGNTTHCIPVDALCGEEPQCPDGSDLSYTHAGCLNGTEDWDMDDAVRVGQLIEISDFWVYRKSRDLALDDGPESDHTNVTGYRITSGRNGGYIAADGIHPKATLVLPGYTVSDTCVNFWYYMDGEGADRLDVYQQNQGSQNGTLRWSREGSLGKRWRQGLLSVKQNSKVYFVTESLPNCSCIIALDDISRTPGPCPAGEDVSTMFNDDEDRKWSIEGGRVMTDSEGNFVQSKYNEESMTLRSPYAGVVGRWWPSDQLCFILSYQYETPHPSGKEASWRIYLKAQTKNGDAVASNMSYPYPVTRGEYWRRVTLGISPRFWNMDEVPFYMEVTAVSDGTGSAIRVRSPVLHYGNCSLLAACLRDEFQCAQSGCVPKTVLCDGIKDCEDGSDEWEPSVCSAASSLVTVLAVSNPLVLVIFVVHFSGGL